MPSKPTFGRHPEIHPDEMTPELREGYDFIVKERGQALSPYEVVVQSPDLTKVA